MATPVPQLSSPAFRDLVMAAPIMNIASAEGSGTITLTASESGTLYLADAVISANLSTAASAASPDVTNQVAITSAVINGAIELVRGRGNNVAPAGAFSFGRGTNQIPWPAILLKSGNTVAISLTSEALNAANLDCMFAAPFSPIRGNARASAPTPGGPATYAASVVAEVDTDADLSCAWTADEAGTLSLGSIQTRAYNDLASAGAAAGDWANGLSGVQIKTITLPSGDAVLIGAGTLAMPATYFAAGQRSYSFGKLGNVRVAAGDVITMTGVNLGSTTTNFSWGARFWPDASVGYSGCP